MDASKSMISVQLNRVRQLWKFARAVRDSNPCLSRQGELSPRLHPEITQEVAANESQRAPIATRRETPILDVFFVAHNPKVAGSNPAPATIKSRASGSRSRSPC